MLYLEDIVIYFMNIEIDFQQKNHYFPVIPQLIHHIDILDIIY